MFAIAAFLILILSASGEARAQSRSPFRYDDDPSNDFRSTEGNNWYDQTKYVPLGDRAQEYLSFGGDVRERVEAVDSRLLGFGSKQVETYDLSRVLLFADVQYDAFRVFVQCGSHEETGREHALPTDVDRADLQQGFLDYACEVGSGRLTLRAGRFEMSFDGGALIGLRDGPNVRQVWDGAWAYYTLKDARLDAFLVRPVDVTPDYFDDHGIPGQTLWGVHLDAAPATTAPVKFSAFYYGSIMPQVIFAPRPGREETHTAGVRALAARGAFDGSVGLIGQAGTFAGRGVLAWAGHADGGWTLPLPWTPRLGIRADVLSGGNDAHGTVHTFNALYPNYAYSTEATIEAPANLLQAGMTLDASPWRDVTVRYTLEGLWRYSTQDAFYAAPTFPLVRADGTSRRFSGVEQQIEVTWHLNRFIDLTTAYVRFDPAAFLRSGHAGTENFGMTEVAFHF